MRRLRTLLVLPTFHLLFNRNAGGSPLGIRTMRN